MLLTLFLLIPVFGIFTISAGISYDISFFTTRRIKAFALSTYSTSFFIDVLFGLIVFALINPAVNILNYIILNFHWLFSTFVIVL